jgi:hypothetical protein
MAVVSGFAGSGFLVEIEADAIIAEAPMSASKAAPDPSE